MRAASLGILAILCLATPAGAHSPVPGIEGFYLGLLHPISTPAQALLMLGLGLLTGGLAKASARWLLIAFFTASGAGLLWTGAAMPDMAAFAVATLASTLAALAAGRFFPAMVALVILGGLVVGAISVPEGGLFRDRLITMAGSFIGANLLLLYISGLVIIVRERVSRPWIPIAFRVAAAWVAAISAMMLAIYFAPDPSVASL